MATAAPPVGAPSPALAPPPGNPRFALFDSLRGIAVLAVVVFHAFLVCGSLERRLIGDAAAVLGSLGPIVFFAISGFLLYRPWVAARAAQAPPLRTARYARRRALRILPAYWTALTVLAIYPGITGAFSGDWWRYYLLLQVYDGDTLSRGIPVAWTLCVELSFYVALPLWAVAMRALSAGAARPAWLRAELGALVLLAAAGAGLQVAAAREAASDLAAQTLAGQCAWFALGMAMAVVSVGAGDRRAAIVRPGLCWSGAGAAFAALTALNYDTGGLLGIVQRLSSPQPYARTLAELALTGALVALLLAPAVFAERVPSVPRRVLTAAPLVWLGVISYGVYLWHLTIAELLALRTAPQHFTATGLDLAAELPGAATPVVLVLTLAASGAAAAFSYRFVELPFLRRKEKSR